MAAQRLTNEPASTTPAAYMPLVGGGVFLTIGDKEYVASPLPASEVRVGFRLAGVDSEYEAWETEHGLHGCTCPDFEYRSGPAGRPCRHLIALYRLGLLSRFVPPGCGPAADPTEVFA